MREYGSLTVKLPTITKILQRDSLNFFLLLILAVCGMAGAVLHVIYFRGAKGLKFLPIALFQLDLFLFSIFMIIAFRTFRLHRLHQRSIFVIGEILIVAAEMGYKPLMFLFPNRERQSELLYTYSYQGRRFDGRRSLVLFRHPTIAWEPGYPVTIAVDPKRPDRSDILNIYF
jgi:hypothetical protein